MPGPLQLGNGDVHGSQQAPGTLALPKPAKTKKPGKPNFQNKAGGKIKDAKSLLTDAKMWAHKVDEERKKGKGSMVSLGLI